MGERGMDHCLQNLNKLRVHGIEVQDNSYDPTQYHIGTGFENVIVLLFT